MRDTILEFTARIQELQNEVNCMNDSKDFKDAESVRSGLSHVPSQPSFFPPFRDPGGMLSRFVGMPSRNDRPPDTWDTHGISGNVFVNPTASSSTPDPGIKNICHWKNAEFETKHQKYKSRVVFRGDIVKDDSGSYALFTEQGSSALQMTATKVMGIISRLPRCAGQAADAVSAYTQVKMDDAPKSLIIPKSECPDIWIRLPRHKWPKSWSSVEDPVVPLERNLYGHPLAGLLLERQFEKILLMYGFGEGFHLGMLFRTP